MGSPFWFARHTHPSINPDYYKESVYYICSLESAPLAGWRERKGEGPRPDICLPMYPWVNAILALGESSPGKQRWIELLKERYENAEQAALV